MENNTLNKNEILKAHDIYAVEYADYDKTQKELHILGYFFEEDNGIQCVCFCGLLLPIPTTREEITNEENACEQYIEDLSDKDFDDMFEAELKNYKKLDILEVTQDTPCGMYIDM